MSLDVYLEAIGSVSLAGERIFIREDGQMKEITKAEWDARFPNREPVVVHVDDDRVYSANITHNLGNMAREAGLYIYLWSPEIVPVRKAKDLIEPLRTGLAHLKSNPNKFKKLNPENGWGNYEGLVHFVEQYLQACEDHPYADVRVSR